MKEIWKDIPNYEGKYQISNLGRVRNIQKENYILKFSNDGKGYQKVKLCNNGKCKSFNGKDSMLCSTLKHSMRQRIKYMRR